MGKNGGYGPNAGMPQHGKRPGRSGEVGSR